VAENDEQTKLELAPTSDGDLVTFIRSAPDFSLLDLDRIPGASERIEQGLADAEAGRTIPLDEF